MGIKSAHQLAKEEAKNRRSRRSEFQEKKKEWKNLPEIEKIKLQIRKYESFIHSCNYDLANTQHGNISVLNKRNCLIRTQNELKQKLKELENDNAL